MMSTTINPLTQSMTVRIIQVALLIGVALLACWVMALDPNEPY
jgi:hypothetical protein